LIVTGRLKNVLDRVVNEGADPYEAGRAEGMLARSIRKALAKPHVLAYLRAARQVLREQARAQNIHHMIEMSRSSTNEMAKLGAMKLLEQNDEYSRPNAHGQTMPGLVICIVSRESEREASTVDIAPRAVEAELPARYERGGAADTVPTSGLARSHTARKEMASARRQK
jgi:hypothetical protein